MMCGIMHTHLIASPGHALTMDGRPLLFYGRCGGSPASIRKVMTSHVPIQTDNDFSRFNDNSVASESCDQRKPWGPLFAPSNRAGILFG